jgi:hydroxymethylbilane synthase
MLPAVGQGALAIECQASRADLFELLRPLHDATTAACANAERALSRALAGSCNVPLAGFAQAAGGRLTLRGYVGAPDGTRHVSGQRDGDMAQAEALGAALADELRQRGAAEILAALNAS